MVTSGVEQIVGLFPWLLLGATLLGFVAAKLRVPYATMLVLGGVVTAAVHVVPVPQLDPDVLLFAFLPPLLFEAAFHLDTAELRVVARPMLLLAVPGTLITAALVAAILTVALNLPPVLALVFGSIVSATDPVAVVSVFRRLRAPKRLSVIMEGESLINDGVAITLYTALLALALTGEADVLGAVVLFVRQAVGGVVLGACLGLVFLVLTSAIEDHLLEMTLSTALAYGSYLAAQRLGCSGALACVTAGLVHGSLGRRAGMSEANRHLLDDLWEYLGFLANAVVFLLLGLTVDFAGLWLSAIAVLVAILAVFLARLAVVEGLRLVPGVRATTSIAERLILVWGGLRGALTAALALALPPGTPARQQIIAMAFGVVLFSLIVQGATLPFVLEHGVSRARRQSP